VFANPVDLAVTPATFRFAGGAPFAFN